MTTLVQDYCIRLYIAYKYTCSTAFYVAGFSSEKHNELLQLLLPEKLLPADKQVPGCLCVPIQRVM